MPDSLRNLLLRAEPEIPDGHEERFQLKMRNQEAPKQKKWLLYLVGSAAAVAALILMIVTFSIRSDNEAYEKRTLADVSPQTRAMEKSISTLLDEKEQRIDFSQPELFEQVKLYRQLEVEYTELESALNTNFGNEKVVRAMMDNYRNRLRVLENILLITRLNKNHEQQLSNQNT
ncbi:MAG: hypothetical protein RL226_1575 [Bacteroidota bacterium]